MAHGGPGMRFTLRSDGLVETEIYEPRLGLKLGSSLVFLDTPPQAAKQTNIESAFHLRYRQSCLQSLNGH